MKNLERSRTTARGDGDRDVAAKRSSGADTAGPDRGLAQRLGNQGMQRLLNSAPPASGRTHRVIQAKLSIGATNDPLEAEADRIADQVLAEPAHSAVTGAPLRIQRFTGQPSVAADTAPASVDRVLASPGRPLEPALQQDMEQRFGYDFSRVRVHSGAAAEQSAQDVTANAYTVGPSIVFGAGRFAPGTHAGRRLIAHELTHVVQQSSPDGVRAGQSNEKRGLFTSHKPAGRQLSPALLLPTPNALRSHGLVLHPEGSYYNKQEASYFNVVRRRWNRKKTESYG